MPFPVGAVPPIVRLGGALGGIVFGKRKRSACRTVSAGDVAGFLGGTVVPHIVWERAEDIVEAMGVQRSEYVTFGGAVEYLEAKNVMRFQDVANLHLSVFVPICQRIEGDNLSDDPASGTGAGIYAAARAEFRNQIRMGRIPEVQVPLGGGTGIYDPTHQYGIPGGIPGPPQAPSNAGFGGGTAIVLGLGALLLLGGLKS